jgi:hypothetical protein
MSAATLKNNIELYDSGDNYAYYSCSTGHEILNSENFPPAIMDFLAGEKDAIRTILLGNKNQYDALLEIGCGNARNIELSLDLNLQYYGIDFIEKEITAARHRLKQDNIIGHLKCISVLDLNHATTPIAPSMRTVCLFPFNVFGNIFEPTRILQIMHTLNYGMLISTYRNDVEKDAIIHYYEACGLNVTRMIKLDNGTMFISKEGFKSIIYNSEYIQHIATQLGLMIDIFEFGLLGKLYYIR